MLQNLERVIGYEFRSGELLRNALTHSSYANERRESGIADNERLEFLGDSVLGFVTARYLFESFPERPEGDLTRLRADLVCEKSLARAARGISLGDCLLLGKGEEQNGGRGKDSILSDAMESVIAAVYLDGGLEPAADLIIRLILSDLKIEELAARDYKTELQELVQRKKNQQITYELLDETGPDHNKVFRVCVLLNGTEVGVGEGTSKKRAAQSAARQAITRLFPKK